MRIRIGSQHVRAEHGVRPIQLPGRLEPAAIDFNRLSHQIRREMRGKGKRQPEHGRELRAEEARTQQPDWNVESRTRHGSNVLSRLRICKIMLQFLHVLWELLGAVFHVAA